MKIFLVGFPGSGKSTFGKQLSEESGFPFYDLDQCIEQKEGLTINDIFERYRESYFRLQEWRYLKDFKEKKQFILATGGGTPCFNKNMDWMNKIGCTVYLEIAPKKLYHRLKTQTRNRPLLKNKTDIELKDYIQNTLHNRLPFYKQATVTLKESQAKDIYRVVEMIKNRG